MPGTTNIESSVEGKSIRRAAAKLLLLDSNQDQRFQRPVCCRYTKEECARTHRTRMPDCVPPCRSNPFFADWIPGPIPWPITADRLADGARVELARDFRPNSLSRTAPLPHGPPSMLVFSVRGTPAKPRWTPHGNDFHAGFAEWGGFEPPGACAPAAFGTVAFDRSATTPLIHTKGQTG